MSVGRGGAGNIRSPSRDVVRARPGELSSISETEQIEYERSLIRNREAARTSQMVCLPCLAGVVARSLNLHPSQLSGGRGGVGNMVRRDYQSQSLSQSSPQGIQVPTASQPGHGRNDLAFRGSRTHKKAASKEEPSRKTAL